MSEAPTITQDPEKPIAPEILAAAIVEISAGMKRVLGGRLNQDALELLIQHNTRPQIARRDIRIVMNAIADLERAYVRPLPKAAKP